ncbi:MAG: glycosyltransferase family 2 protein [Butyrivibrio sp.]|nr:glycosyltransferase family 2 protein [Butyrivibrio sp.]
MSIVVLIPSYNPQEALINLVKELHAEGMRVLVVNDGSSEEHKRIFDRVRGYAEVIGYDDNRGKGCALKTGIRHIASEYEADGFVTADGDGQHKTEDIIKIARILESEKTIVLGSRSLSKEIPFRSRIGNDMSKLTYTLATGRYLRDNQSGLRGFPADMAKWLLEVGGNHYEYEMNVLIKAAFMGCPIAEVPIQTVYENNNSASHFKPILDTVRIQSRLLLGGLVPLIIYIACAVGIYCMSRRSELLFWGAAWNGGLWLLHCAYSVTGFFCMHNKKEAAVSACRILVRHILFGAASAAVALLTGNAALTVAAPLLLIAGIAYLSGKLRKNRTGENYEGRCKRACP